MTTSASLSAAPDSNTGTRYAGKLAAQWMCLWMVPVCGVIFVIAFVSFPGFLPPMAPELNPAQVSAFYGENQSALRFSMIIYNICGVMLVPFFMVVVAQMKRMATPTQVLAYCYLTATANGATLFAIADLLWLIAAFRPERNSDLVVLLNDMAWITFTAPVGMIVVMNLCLAVAIFLDGHPRPIFPRWVAYISIFTAAAMAPSACAAIFRTGPFAWNGAVSFWLRILAFGLYVVTMFCALYSALKRQSREESAAV